MTLNAAGIMVASTWCDMPKHYPGFNLGEFVVMPNHFHGLVQFSEHVGAIHELPLHKPSRRQMGLAKLMGRFKMVSAKAINQLHNSSGESVWQRNYFEHIIRSENAYLKAAEYIQPNPQRWTEDTYHV